MGTLLLSYSSMPICFIFSRSLRKESQILGGQIMKRRKMDKLTLSLETSVIEELKNLAENQTRKYSNLANKWIKESIEREKQVQRNKTP